MANPWKHSRSGVVDRIEHDDPKILNFPVVIILHQNENIELYAVQDGKFGGLETYVGVLQNLYSGRSKQMQPESLTSIMTAIKKHIAEDPVSYQGYYWLKALYPSGLLGYAEENLRGK